MISVCLATHNGERFIHDQIESILNQIGEEDEVIVSDDGSTDKTIEILKLFKDKRIRILNYTQPFKSKHVHENVCRNFENALIHANGNIVFLSDQDDWWMPDKVRMCLDALKNNMLVVHRAIYCDDKLKSSGRLMYGDEFNFKNFLSLNRGQYFGCTLAFRGELLKYILPFPKKLVLHDQWIGCMAELVGKVYYERTPLIKYRKHTANTSWGVSNNKLWFKLYYRLYMFFALLIRSRKKLWLK